jgi:hypothetical protein
VNPVKRSSINATLSVLLTFAAAASPSFAADRIVDPALVQQYVTRFQEVDPSPRVFPDAAAGKAAGNPVPSLQGTFLVPDDKAATWISSNVPLLDCPDETIREMYYYRWWSYRSHIKKFSRSAYTVLTEFWQRESPVSSAVGHHIMEGRWDKDSSVLDDYLNYWLNGEKNTPSEPADKHNFSSWTIWAAYQRYLVNGDRAFITAMLPHFIADYEKWEKEHLAPNGLYWQRESQDAMEESINGSRAAQYRRPTISSYMFGNAQAIAAIARLAGKNDLAATYDAKAASIKKAVQEILWDKDAGFFKIQWPDGYLGSFREEIGFVPWYFELPDKDKGYEGAWDQLLDDGGFNAPFGITTAERRAPGFRTHGTGHGCEWDGAVWPYSTAHTLTALANLLNHYPAGKMTKEVYYHHLQLYAKSQHRDGKPYIGEYLDETNGRWLRNDLERGRHYNHSTYCDLVINGLVGLRPRADNTVEVSPLLPEGAWDFFALDNISYHGQTLAIVWDKNGTKYNRGEGLTVFANGQKIAQSPTLGPVKGNLP